MPNSMAFGHGSFAGIASLACLVGRPKGSLPRCAGLVGETCMEDGIERTMKGIVGGKGRTDGLGWRHDWVVNDVLQLPGLLFEVSSGLVRIP